MLNCPAPDARLDRSRPRIHIVDDDGELLHALQFALNVEGFDVTTHRDPREMLGKRSPLCGECLILDQVMAGMSGLDLLAVLRQYGVRMPAILITTNPGAMIREQAAKAGVPIVEKPLLGNMLSDAIRQAIGDPPA